VPELPEVETMRRGVLPVEGARIAGVRLPRPKRLRPIAVGPSPAAFRRRLKGRRIERVGRAGKRVVLHLDSGVRVVFEPRMTGLALLADPPTDEHVRARLALDGGDPHELVFWDRRGLGTLSAWTPSEYEERLGPHKLGPDALELDPALLAERLDRSTRPIKVALLDQRALAGVGNIYASESLHRARIHPARPCADLSAREWRALWKALDGILREAIRYEGSTLSDGTYRNALNQDGGYQNHFRVYDREGERCPRCRGKGTVERTVQAQRATFFCAGCQR
jgi:formamidopyrimidine-DNA glycosylase